MIDLGVVRPGQTIQVPFSAYGKTNGESITITGLAVTDVEVYKDGSVTQRSSDNGYTLLDTDGIDFDGLVGIHGVSISLADNSDAGFWAAGSWYTVVIASITIDSQVVNFIPVTFRIGYRAAFIDTTIATLSSQTSFTLTSGPAEDDAINGMWCLIHDVASAVQLGHAVILDYTGATKTVTLAAGTTFTAAATDNISVMGYAPLQPTVAGRPLDVSTGGEAGVDWANVGNPTTTLNLSGTTVKTTTDVEAIVGSGTHGNAALKTLIDIIDNIIDTEFPALIVTIGTPAGASIAADLLVIDNFVDDIESRLTATRAGYLDNLSAGAVAQASDLTAILADTNELQTDWANGGRLDLLIDAILADTDSLDTTKITTARAAVLTDWIDGGRLDLILDARASQASVDTVDDLLDTEIGAIQTTLGALFTTALTESYRAAGAAPTMAQVAFELIAHHGDSEISGVTKTLRKINATTAKTFTLDSATVPTSITEAT